MLIKSNPIHLDELNQYSQSFARKLTDYFFIDHKQITGKEILNFCDIKQVNLLIIKHLFDKWQAEMGKLESPYFDYDQPDVQNAIKTLMNVLSQYIRISKDEFYHLLKEAVKDSLLLVFNPKMYYNLEFKKFEGNNISIEYFKNTLKYIQFNKELLKDFIEKLAKKTENEIASEEAMAVFEDVYSDNERFIEPVEWRIKTFNSIYPLELDKILKQTQNITKLTQILTDKENQIFVKGKTNIPPTASKENIVESYDLSKTIDLAEEKKSEILFEKPKIQEEKISMPLSTILDVKEEKKTEKSKNDLKYEEDEKDNRTLLNDILKSEKNNQPSVLDKFQHTKIENIRAAISLNQKFTFINKLFNGNNFVFNDALDRIENAGSYEQSLKVIGDDYAKQFKWDFESEEVKGFLELIERKFC